MFKIGHEVDGAWVAFDHAKTLTFDDAANRLVCGTVSGDTRTFCSLVNTLPAPLCLLYVLHTPRGEGEPCRYQSPAIENDALQAFLAEYADFLAQDARFDFWVHSLNDGSTIVWDRHNRIHVYGDSLSQCRTTLEQLGYAEGEVKLPTGRHTHHYHAELDATASKLLVHFEWYRTPLHEADLQR